MIFGKFMLRRIRLICLVLVFLRFVELVDVFFVINLLCKLNCFMSDVCKELLLLIIRIFFKVVIMFFLYMFVVYSKFLKIGVVSV